VFSQEQLEASLRGQGCPESFVSPIVSDFRLFVPVVLSQLGEDGILNLVEQQRESLGLGPQEPAWRMAARFIAGWAQECVQSYQSEKA
jgi:hypothetical protein